MDRPTLWSGHAHYPCLRRTKSPELFCITVAWAMASGLPCIYFQTPGVAVIVLGNSSHAGDAVDCISRLVTSIVCGYELSTVELRPNLRFYTDLEVGRWKKMDGELRRKQESQPRAKRIPEASGIVGRYVNIGSSLEMTIALGETPEETSRSRAEPFVGAKLKFGSVARLALDLWRFSDDTLCFFSNEVDYQKWCISYLGSWPQFLIHLSYDNITGSVSGLWWQFDPARDGIWLQMVDSQRPYRQEMTI